MCQVIQLDDYRPHIAVMTGHDEMTLVPVFLAIAMAHGEIDLEGNANILARGIIRQWLIDNGYEEV